MGSSRDLCPQCLESGWACTCRKSEVTPKPMSAETEHGPHCAEYNRACRQCMDEFTVWKQTRTAQPSADTMVEQDALALLDEALALIPQKTWSGKQGFEIEAAKLKARLKIKLAKDRIERLEAEKRMLVADMERIAADASVSVGTDKQMYRGWRAIAVERINIARSALEGIG